MPSIGTVYDSRSAIGFIGDEGGLRTLFVEEGRRPLDTGSNHGDSPGALARAAAAMARVKDEIDELWHDSMTSEDGAVSERLVAVSHSLRRLSHLLDEGPAIG